MSPLLETKPFLRRASRLAASLGVLAFWCGLFMAAQHYPSHYDWRYMSVSHLLSPERNPAGYLWASAGTALCGLLGLYWVMVLARGHAESARDKPKGLWALQFAYCCMLCAAVLPKWLLRIRKGHELVVALAFAGLLIGMVRLMLQTIEQLLLTRMRTGGHARLYAIIAASAAVLPILLAGLAQSYFYYLPPDLQGQSFSWIVRGRPVLLLFPFWEWLMCVVLSAYMVILSLATRPTRRTGMN